MLVLLVTHSNIGVLLGANRVQRSSSLFQQSTSTQRVLLAQEGIANANCNLHSMKWFAALDYHERRKLEVSSHWVSVSHSKAGLYLLVLQVFSIWGMQRNLLRVATVL
jgi:hypothetical protein